MEDWELGFGQILHIQTAIVILIITLAGSKTPSPPPKLMEGTLPKTNMSPEKGLFQ